MSKIVDYIKSLSYNEKIQELLIKTIGNILLKEKNIENYIKNNEDKIIHIRDWISSIIENNEEWKNPRVLTLDALNNSADKYFEKKNNNIQTIELDETHEKLVADLGDYYVVQMLTPEALDNESKIMQHCIGHGYYDDRLHNKNYLYLSLRDKFNKAHVTVEIVLSDNIAQQIQGKQNDIPNKKYLEILLPWLNEKKYFFNLNRSNLIFNKNDNKIYFKNEMPDNCEINGNLSFEKTDIFTLPKNLTVNGNLDLSHSEIKELPDNLTVNGYLKLFNCQNIQFLPKNLIVKDSLNLSSTNIEELPDDIQIKGVLDLRNSKIKRLPDGLSLNFLDLSNSINLIKLPKKLTVNGINLGKCKIQKLPNDIIIKKNLYLDNSDIQELPDNLSLNGDLSLTDCKNIKKLPENLKINFCLYLRNTEIKELPNNLSCQFLMISENIKHLVHENINFDKIYITSETSVIHKEYTRDTFFQEIKIRKNIK